MTDILHLVLLRAKGTAFYFIGSAYEPEKYLAHRQTEHLSELELVIAQPCRSSAWTVLNIRFAHIPRRAKLWLDFTGRTDDQDLIEAIQSLPKPVQLRLVK